ncbi:dynein light chain Tctex-type 5-A-like [Mya arenaria]|uniref:dynein light chain Tctex-type 5-A-like n=1 Tax=Mya arenaria TaxID=6604 RepID=UPI0022E7DB04|nr:dynein light chain Tctex-type 5-A-like [Mya arenaria]
MKDTASHRKRTKSESDRTADHKAAGKGQHHGPPHGSSQQGSHHAGTQHAHAASHHKAEHKADHGHQKGEHGHHKSEHGHHKSDHGQHRAGHTHHGHHGDHGHHDDFHHSASSHVFRQRTNTMLSRGGHSVHGHGHDIDKRSVATNEGPPPVVFYENTYKLTPDCKVHEGKIRDAIQTVLEENITENKYDPSICGSKCKIITEIMKERVKQLDMNRFKFVCMANIGQLYDQSMVVTSRCLWDHRFDNAVSVTHKSGDIIAVGLVFAIYAE